MLRLVIFCCALAALPDVARANSGFEQDLTGWTTDGDGAAVKDPALNEAVPLRLGPAPRVALLLVFLASLILLSGCAPKTSVGGGSPLVSLPAGQANGSLTVWSWSIAAKSLQDLTPAFEKQDPHAKVEVDMTGARMTTRLMLSLAAGVGAPDVSQLQCQDAPHYSVTGRLTDLTPVAGRYKALFPASLWDNCTLKGRVYAIPWDIGPCAIFYKRGLFRRYGIDPTSIQTWDDYIQAGQVILHKSGGRTKMLPLGSNDMMGMFEILLQQTGGQVFDDQGRVAVGSPSAKQAVALLGRLRRAGICSDVPAYGQEWMAGFNDEIIATYPGAVWLGGIIKDSAGDYAGKSAEWGVFRLPAVTPGGPRIANLGGSVLVIPAQCPNKSAAWAFIQYALCTREGQLAQYRHSHLFPAFLPALQTSAMDEPDPFFGGQAVGRLFATDAADLPHLNRTAAWAEAVAYVGQDLSHWAAEGLPETDILGPLAQKLHRRLDVPLAPETQTAFRNGEKP